MVRESHSLPAQPWRQPRRQPSPVTDRDHRMSSHPRTRVYRSTRRFAANNRSERLREVRHLSAETRRSGKSVTPRSPVGTAKTPAHACDQFLRRPCRGGELEHLCAALTLLRWVTRRLYLGGWVPCLPIKQLHSGSGRLRSPDRSTVEGFAWLPEARRKFRVSVRRRCRSHVRQCSDSSADRDSSRYRRGGHRLPRSAASTTRATELRRPWCSHPDSSSRDQYRHKNRCPEKPGKLTGKLNELLAHPGNGSHSPGNGDGHPSTPSRKSDSRRSGAPGICDSQRWTCRHLDGRDLIVTFSVNGSLDQIFEKYILSWSPVTESNRRPSPYHACRFRLMPSG